MVKRWRYYCDFCKKSLGTRASMTAHESGCTANPERHCKFCDLLNGGQGTPLAELRQFVRDRAVYRSHGESDREYGTLSPEHAALLREMTNGCPVCMFAAIRQEDCFITDFDLKKELEPLWGDINTSRWEGVGR